MSWALRGDIECEWDSSYLDRLAARVELADPEAISVWMLDNAGYLSADYALQCRQNEDIRLASQGMDI